MTNFKSDDRLSLDIYWMISERWGDAKKGARPRSMSEGPAQVFENIMLSYVSEIMMTPFLK